jgi:hypothetical protein
MAGAAMETAAPVAATARVAQARAFFSIGFFSSVCARTP